MIDPRPFPLCTAMARPPGPFLDQGGGYYRVGRSKGWLLLAWELRLRLERHNSLILLFDQEVGRIGAAIEAGVVNAYRISAADAVAAAALARRDAETLTVFGAGNQSRFECLAQVRPLRRVLVVARDQAGGEVMVADLRQ
jgi:ornithine cyclodeaminase/alanine dehydrogenase-like protein (mu-crystallin family)